MSESGQWPIDECLLVAKQLGLKIQNSGEGKFPYSLIRKSDGKSVIYNASYARMQATLKRLDREAMDSLERNELNKHSKEKLMDMVISYRKLLDSERKYRGK